MYLDFQATTPVDPEVLAKMLPYFREHFGNPSSQGHSWGWTAQSAVEKAREQVALLLNADKKEIYFTSGSTESNNWAFFGLVNLWQREQAEASNHQPLHIICSSIEHKSVLEPLHYLEKFPYKAPVKVTYIKPGPYGKISLQDIQSARTEFTQLVSLHWGHNEISTLQNIEEIAQWCHQEKIYFHTDATQVVGKIKVDLQKVPVDLLSVSSHKLYGPKGVGALFVRQKNPRVSLDALIHGGPQEKGLRAGTLNVPGIVGFGEACHQAIKDIEVEYPRLAELRKKLIENLLALDSSLQINTHPEQHLPHAVSISFPSLSPDQLQIGLAGWGLSSGSACLSGELGGSPILKAIGLSDQFAQRTLRLSLGKGMSTTDIEHIVYKFKSILTVAQESALGFNSK